MLMMLNFLAPSRYRDCGTMQVQFQFYLKVYLKVSASRGVGNSWYLEMMLVGGDEAEQEHAVVATGEGVLEHVVAAGADEEDGLGEEAGGSPRTCTLGNVLDNRRKVLQLQAHRDHLTSLLAHNVVQINQSCSCTATPTCHMDKV
jgi:hypothetical protein